MEKNILHLNENEINELLYYYEQGIIIGKEEIILKVIDNMKKLNFDTNIIKTILEVDQNTIENYLN
ncbi:MAG TPA: hypothetical protein IAC20_05040 [Candidatus Faecisoma merdavium]|nr:hypothetical protein [Candidatus Faecisoma merdavium]